MTVIELLDDLISDFDDYIDEYKSDIRLTSSRLEKQQLEIRIDELRKWKTILKVIREEQE